MNTQAKISCWAGTQFNEMHVFQPAAEVCALTCLKLQRGFDIQNHVCLQAKSSLVQLLLSNVLKFPPS